MQYLLCRHIKTNGIQCQAPSLTDADYCYFHNRLHLRHTAFRHTPDTRDNLVSGQHIQLTALEDRESVQVALSLVINALATGKLETKRATALLYGLQLASMNASRLNLTPSINDAILTAESTPDGLDLAEPGAICEILPYDPIQDMVDAMLDEEEEDRAMEEAMDAIEADQRARG
jgi:hypothetical protein